MRPIRVDTSSQFYRADQKFAYQSNSIGHDNKDYSTLKHKFLDLIDQKMISIHTVVPNVNSDPLPKHGGVNINMIETDDHWCMTKAIVLIVHDKLERVVASLCIKEKKEFVILIPAKDVAFVPVETPARPSFVILTALAHGMTRSSRCYTPNEFGPLREKEGHRKEIDKLRRS